MKVGIFITNQHTLATDMVSALEDQFVMVRHARDRGWDSLMTGQHYLNEGDNKLTFRIGDDHSTQKTIRVIYTPPLSP